MPAHRPLHTLVDKTDDLQSPLCHKHAQGWIDTVNARASLSGDPNMVTQLIGLRPADEGCAWIIGSFGVECGEPAIFWGPITVEAVEADKYQRQLGRTVEQMHTLKAVAPGIERALEEIDSG